MIEIIKEKIEKTKTNIIQSKEMYDSELCKKVTLNKRNCVNKPIYTMLNGCFSVIITLKIYS